MEHHRFSASNPSARPEPIQKRINAELWGETGSHLEAVLYIDRRRRRVEAIEYRRAALGLGSPAYTDRVVPARLGLGRLRPAHPQARPKPSTMARLRLGSGLARPEPQLLRKKN